MSMSMNGLVDIDLFSEEIYKIYNFGYATCTGEFKREFHTWITSRLGLLAECAKYINIEDAYVETEWKDMVALHYINTSYASTILSRVIRVHFFSKNQVNNNSYIGFITIRPIEELSIALSYVFLNWRYVARAYAAEEARFVCYKKRIHCLTKELYIDTYPILVQDSIVTCCADVNIITLSRFLSHKYGGRKKAEIRDICRDDYNFAIPREIKETYFEELCIKHHVPYKAKEVDRSTLKLQNELTPEERSKIGLATNTTIEGLCRYIDSYLDSNLPVVIRCNNHMVQIVGWIIGKNKQKRHIVFDDSGYLYPDRAGDQNTGPVFYTIDLQADFLKYEGPQRDRLCDENITDENLNQYLNKSINIGIPQYDRVYIDYAQYETLLETFIQNTWGNQDGDKNNSTGDAKVDLYLQFVINNRESSLRRSRLVECSELVMFIRKNYDMAMKNLNRSRGIEYMASVLEEILVIFERESLPHYIWYTELYDDEGNKVALCADPTKLYNSSHVDKVFYNSRLSTNEKMIPIGCSMWEDIIIEKD